MEKRKETSGQPEYRPETGTENRFRVHPAFTAGVFFFCCELLLKNTGTPNLLSVSYLLFFCAFCGILLWLLTSFSESEKANRTCRGIIYILTAVLFLINAFVYRQFRIFYDIRTVTAGGADMFDEFRDAVFSLIFSGRGLLSILAYLLTAGICIACGHFFENSGRIDKKKLLKGASAAVLCLCGAFGCAAADPAYRVSYYEQYNFHNSVSSFGLMTSLCRDIGDILFHKEADFTEVAAEEPEIQKDRNSFSIFRPNRLDIDFESISDTGNDLQKRLDRYVMAQPASSQNDHTGLFKGKNLIMITAEAFSGALIDRQLTPTLYRLAENGYRFTDFTQPSSAGTTGGEFQILFGMLPVDGGVSLKKTKNYHNLMTMGAQLDRLGYEGWAFHNNTYTFYDRHETHNNLGYSNGFTAVGSGMEEYITDQWPESDLEMIRGTMPLYLEQDKPFNVYYMTVSGHNGYSPASSAMVSKNWDRVKDLPYSDPVKGYIAANLELEDALAYMVSQLEEKGIAEDTVIVLCSDHFPYGIDESAGFGEMPYLSELYGHEVRDVLDRDSNRLIIWSGCLEKEEPVTISEPVSSLDILPTLSNLFGTPFDSRIFPGRDVFARDTVPLVFDTNYDWKTDKGSYNAAAGVFTPENGEADEEYVSRISAVVKNKIAYCKSFNDTDYLAHLFPDLAGETQQQPVKKE